MAAIDKTYVSSYDDWKEIVDYAKDAIFTCPNGQELKLIDYIYFPNKSKSEVEEWLSETCEIPVMSTSWSMDYFLIKYCPIQLVQDRMVDVYGEEYCTSVKNGTSKYDTFVRQEGGKHVSYLKRPKFRKPIKHFSSYTCKYMHGKYFVQVDVPDGEGYTFYNERYDTWVLPYELGEGFTNTAITKCKSVKSVIRKIRKWNLPIGYKIHVFGKFKGEDFEMVVTK